MYSIQIPLIFNGKICETYIFIFKKLKESINVMFKILVDKSPEVSSMLKYKTAKEI